MKSNQTAADMAKALNERCNDGTFGMYGLRDAAVHEIADGVYVVASGVGCEAIASENHRTIYREGLTRDYAFEPHAVSNLLHGVNSRPVDRLAVAVDYYRRTGRLLGSAGGRSILTKDQIEALDLVAHFDALKTLRSTDNRVA